MHSLWKILQIKFWIESLILVKKIYWAIHLRFVYVWNAWDSTNEVGSISWTTKLVRASSNCDCDIWRWAGTTGSFGGFLVRWTSGWFIRRWCVARTGWSAPSPRGAFVRTKLAAFAKNWLSNNISKSESESSESESDSASSIGLNGWNDAGTALINKNKFKEKWNF